MQQRLFLLLAATILSVFFVPIFYVVFQGLDDFFRKKKPAVEA